MTEGIYDLFESVNTPHYSNAEGSQRIADRIDVHRFDYRPELEGVRVAIFGVLDGRRSGDNEGCGAAPPLTSVTYDQESPKKTRLQPWNL